MKTSRLFISTSLICIGTLALLAGCAADRNLDDYRNDKSKQENAKLQAVSGTYRGALISNLDGSTLGGVTLELQPDIQNERSQDRTVSEGHASLVGTLTFHGNKRAVVTFRDAYYGSEDGVLRAAIPFSSSANAVQLDLNGTLAEGKLTGVLKSLQSSEYGARLELTRDGSLPVNQPLQGKPGEKPETSGSSIRYSSVGKWPNGRPMAVDLTVITSDETAEDEFVNALSDHKFIDLNLDTDQVTQYSFPGARLDRRNNSIRGEAGAAGNKVILTCDSASAGWLCDLKNSSRGTIFSKVLLKAAPNAQRTVPASEIYGASAFIGGGTNPKDQTALSLTITYVEPIGQDPMSPQPLKIMATLNGVYASGNTFAWPFDNVRWDRINGTMTGESVRNGGTQSTLLTMNCHEARFQNWNCSFVSSVGGTLFTNVAFTLK